VPEEPDFVGEQKEKPLASFAFRFPSS